MCIVATARNNMNNSRHQRFLNSVIHLDYENYRLVFVDDMSDDNTLSFMKDFIAENLETINGRWQMMQPNSAERSFSLANKIQAITEGCSEEDIIVDIDADDFFIGTQALNVLNSLYQSSP